MNVASDTTCPPTGPWVRSFMRAESNDLLRRQRSERAAERAASVSKPGGNGARDGDPLVAALGDLGQVDLNLGLALREREERVHRAHERVVADSGQVLGRL